eukprot:TRINITY_DN17633_c0_g1_i1.p1 TRINITY_DN17633_c0_g1~~TRINITY_DN17633_c0_g1_i1.p1  ORF type:complete len:367 (+),score=82.50 TRINITY_DN17633_c0_g1_i1:64-1164(+)
MKPMRGDYNQHSRLQNSMAGQGIPYLDAVLKTTDFKKNTESSPFVIADYGSATGSNSYGPVQTIVTHLHQHQPNREVLVTHVDLPSTDWCKLFALIEKDRYNLSGETTQAKIFTSVVGRSFYEQVLPRESVDIGISTSAVHWLSKLPCRLSKSIFASKLTTTEEEYASFENQAKSDWATFLSQREKELKKGGTLFVLLPIRIQEEEEEKGDDVTKIIDGFLSQEVVSGNLTVEERGELTLPMYLRTTKDLETDVPSSLRVETISPPFKLDGLFEKTLAQGNIESAAEEEKNKRKELFARGFTNFWFAVNEEYFKSKLSASGHRNESQVSQFIQSFKDYVASGLTTLPEFRTRKGAGFVAIIFKKED